MNYKSKKLRASAKGQGCTMQIEGVCNNDTRTTVLAHLPVWGHQGTGTKPPDICGAFMCSACHDVVDMRVKESPYKWPLFKNGEYQQDLRQANAKTLLIWIGMGLVTYA